MARLSGFPGYVFNAFARPPLTFDGNYFLWTLMHLVSLEKLFHRCEDVILIDSKDIRRCKQLKKQMYDLALRIVRSLGRVLMDGGCKGT